MPRKLSEMGGAHTSIGVRLEAKSAINTDVYSKVLVEQRKISEARKAKAIAAAAARDTSAKP